MRALQPPAKLSMSSSRQALAVNAEMRARAACCFTRW